MQLSGTLNPERRGFWKSLKDRLWGYDFFISYHWASGGAYAVNLAQRLRERNYDVFLDRADYASGDDWKAIGEIALRNTQRLVLIATREAVTISKPVEHEIGLFTARNRQVISIVFGDKFEDLDRSQYLTLNRMPDSKLYIEDGKETLASGPSEKIVAELTRTQGVMRRRNLRALLTLIPAVAVIAFAIFAGVSWWQSYLSEQDALVAAADEKKARKTAEEEKTKTQKARDEALTALNDSQHALARSLMSPIGVASQKSGDSQIPDVTVSEAEALWNVAVLTDERVRLLFLKQALAKFTTANQLRNRLDSTVHCAVGLDGGRRLRVINEIVLPLLREKKQSHKPLDLEVRMASLEIGDQLEASRTSSGAEIAHLSVATAIDVIKSQSEPDPRAVVTFRRNLEHLTRREMEVIQADLETFIEAHSTTNASRGIEIKRGPLIGLMLLELKRRLHPNQSTPIIAPSQASGPLELDLSIAQEQFKAHQLFLNPPPFSREGRYIPALSNRGAVAMVLEMRNLTSLGSSVKPIPIREKWKHKPKYPNPTSEDALLTSTYLREEIRKSEKDTKDNSVAIINWVFDFDTVAAKLPEDERRALAALLMETILAKITKTVMTQEFSEVFVILVASAGPDATYDYLLRILSAKSELLAGWEKPGAHATQSVEKSYVVGTLLLRDRSLILDKAKLLNILKYPFCVGAQKEIVLARIVEQIMPQAEKPFESEWELVSWLEAHDPALAEIAKQPPWGSVRLEP